MAFGPKGGLVIGRNIGDPARWKRYRGGTAGQLWIDEEVNNLQDADSFNFHPLIELSGDLASPVWLSLDDEAIGRIYFLSDHEGIGNLYSCLPSGEDLRCHTHHTDFYARNAASDGRRIVYHAGADLYLFDPLENVSTRIPVDFHSPQTQRNRKFVRAGKYLTDWELHPQGEAMALSARGKVFTFANWEGAVHQHGEPHGTRYRLPHWLNDGERLIAVTDARGEDNFVILHTDKMDATALAIENLPELAASYHLSHFLPELDTGRPEAIAVNPKKDHIVFSNHRYELLFLDLETHELRKIDQGKAAPIAGFDWSPDGNWVAYSVSISLHVMVLKLWHAESGETFQLTEPLLRDVAPSFDPQGRYLYFLSYRHFDPVYDDLQFDLNFPQGMKPYLITLRKDLPSPFIPQPKTSEANNKADKNNRKPDKEAEAHKQDADNEEAEAKNNGEFTIDLPGITQRIVAFPVSEGRYGRVLGIKAKQGSDDKVLYSRYPVEGALNRSWRSGGKPPAKGVLWAYKFEEQQEEVLISGITDFKISRDGTKLIYRAGNHLRVLKAGEKPKSNGKPSRESGWIDLGRVKVSVMPGEEWRQMFREAWRLQRDHFWTPDMSQVDWETVLDRYLPLVDRVSSRAEFSDLLWEMQGELGTSHAYELGGDYRPIPKYTQGLLAADFVYDEARGAWRITHIVQGDPSDSEHPRNKRPDSPLNAPGVNVKVGDYVLAVNGYRLGCISPPEDGPPTDISSPGSALVNLAGHEVTLTVLRVNDSDPNGDNGPSGCSHGPPGVSSDRAQPSTIFTVTVEALADETPARYREWVEANRRYVHEVTDGRVGYVHIPDMMARGYAEFHRGYLAEVDREGLIVDVRFNSGGHVSPLILEKLSRRRIGYHVSRWGQVPTPYPPESVMGPIACLTNEHAGSDGDIFCHGFKMLGLGPLIGKRTWGGVVGIWARHALVDGTITTQPEFSHWFFDVGWGVENYGTDPDIEVDNTPQDYAQAAVTGRPRDAQLARAIAEVQKLLAENPPERPTFGDKPSRALPITSATSSEA
jgi:tricorn protease